MKTAFSLRIGDRVIVVKPDPEAPGKSLLIIDNELYRADFRLREDDEHRHESSDRGQGPTRR